MLPDRHFLLSTAVGVAGWALTRDSRAVWLALAGGTLPDIDHAVDYGWYALTGQHRLILPLHGYEWAVPLAIWSNEIWGVQLAAVLVVSYLLHLVFDQLENRTKLFGYSLAYRVYNGFALKRISVAPEAAIQGRLEDINKFKSFLAIIRLWK
jgi:hypothetical protein